MKRTLKNVFALGAAATFLLVTSACAQNGNDPTPTTKDPNASGQTFEVALVSWDIGDVYTRGRLDGGFELEKKRIEEATGDKINFTVFGASDVSAQIDAIRAQISKGIDGVAIVPWRGEAMKQIMGELWDEGIPVMTHNAFIPDVTTNFVSF